MVRSTSIVANTEYEKSRAPFRLWVSAAWRFRVTASRPVENDVASPDPR